MRLFKLLLKVSFGKNYRKKFKLKYSCDIPKIEEYEKLGTLFPHPVGIVISKLVTMGNNCIIFQNVTLGAGKNIPSHPDQDCYPVLGDNVIVFAGAVVAGKIRIGNNVIIGANSFVNKTIPDNAIVAGIPAKVVGENRSTELRKPFPTRVPTTSFGSTHQAGISNKIDAP